MYTGWRYWLCFLIVLFGSLLVAVVTGPGEPCRLTGATTGWNGMGECVPLAPGATTPLQDDVGWLVMLVVLGLYSLPVVGLVAVLAWLHRRTKSRPTP